MLISLEDVDHVALLARLGLDRSERERMRDQLSSILAYVDSLNQLDTDTVTPLTQVVPQVNVTREDVLRPGLSVDDVLANAPQRADDFFAVPAVLADE